MTLPLLILLAQLPHVVTHMQSSAWTLDSEMYLIQTEVVWQRTMGYWKLDTNVNYLVQNTSNIPGWDFWWQVDSSGYLVQKIGD
jgi:hypothetical protein